MIVHVDGAAHGRGQGQGAAGAIVTNQAGQVLDLASCEVKPLDSSRPGVTNVEAEYAGLILGIKLASRFASAMVEIRCDCEVVVRQMTGEFGVKSASIKPWHRQACELARSLKNVRYVHIRRHRNQAANGLAGDALRGQLCQGVRR